MSAQPPSTDLSAARARLLQLVAERAYQYREEPFRLRSGASSNHYIDGKQVTLHAEGAALVGRLVFERVRGLAFEALGGPTLGADPIVGATLAVAGAAGAALEGFIVRKQQKEHGKEDLVAGPALAPGTRVVLVEDVLTTGGALQHAVDAVRALGCEIVRLIVIVDRDQGGRERFASQGIAVESLFTLEEVCAAAPRAAQR